MEKAVPKLSMALLLVSVILTMKFVAVFCEGHSTTRCPIPTPPDHAIFGTKTQIRISFKQYFEVFEKVHFKCDVGYFPSSSDSTMSNFCTSSGKWLWDAKQVGNCSRKDGIRTVDCKKPSFFMCKNKQCIERSKVCDCFPDCKDWSDELGCKNPKKILFIKPNSKKTSGAFTNADYPLRYPNYRCKFVLHTDQFHRIRLQFEEFSLRKRDSKNGCRDYLKINGMDRVYVRKMQMARFGTKGTALSTQVKDKVIVRCGKESFGEIVSSSNRLEIRINLTKQKKKSSKRLKGFAFLWDIVKISKAKEIIRKVETDLKTKMDRKKKLVPGKPRNTSVKSGLFTVLLPIAISALLPLCMMSFLCYHVKTRRERNARKREDPKSQQEGDIVKQGQNLGRMEKYRLDSCENEVDEKLSLKLEKMSVNSSRGASSRDLEYFQQKEVLPKREDTQRVFVSKEAWDRANIDLHRSSLLSGECGGAVLEGSGVSYNNNAGASNIKRKYKKACTNNLTNVDVYNGPKFSDANICTEQEPKNFKWDSPRGKHYQGSGTERHQQTGGSERIVGRDKIRTRNSSATQTRKNSATHGVERNLKRQYGMASRRRRELRLKEGGQYSFAEMREGTSHGCCDTCTRKQSQDRLELQRRCYKAPSERLRHETPSERLRHAYVDAEGNEYAGFKYHSSDSGTYTGPERGDSFREYSRPMKWPKADSDSAEESLYTESCVGCHNGTCQAVRKEPLDPYLSHWLAIQQYEEKERLGHYSSELYCELDGSVGTPRGRKVSSNPCSEYGHENTFNANSEDHRGLARFASAERQEEFIGPCSQHGYEDTSSRGSRVYNASKIHHRESLSAGSRYGYDETANLHPGHGYAETSSTTSSRKHRHGGSLRIDSTDGHGVSLSPCLGHNDTCSRRLHREASKIEDSSSISSRGYYEKKRDISSPMHGLRDIKCSSSPMGCGTSSRMHGTSSASSRGYYDKERDRSSASSRGYHDKKRDISSHMHGLHDASNFSSMEHTASFSPCHDRNEWPPHAQVFIQPEISMDRPPNKRCVSPNQDPLCNTTNIARYYSQYENGFNDPVNDAKESLQIHNYVIDNHDSPCSQALYTSEYDCHTENTKSSLAY